MGFDNYRAQEREEMADPPPLKCSGCKHWEHHYQTPDPRHGMDNLWGQCRGIRNSDSVDIYVDGIFEDIETLGGFSCGAFEPKKTDGGT